MRRFILVSLALASLMAVPAQAAVPRCPLMPDPRGDATAHPTGGGSTPADSQLVRPGDDILSADVWADGKAVTMVMRLAGLPSRNETGAPEAEGFWWIVTLQRGDREIVLWMIERNGYWFPEGGWGSVVEAGDDETGAGAGSWHTVSGVTGRVDSRRAELRVSVPLAALAPHVDVSKGTSWGKVSAWATVLDGPPLLSPAPPAIRYESASGLGSTRDQASTSRKVVIGTPVCAS